MPPCLDAMTTTLYLLVLAVGVLGVTNTLLVKAVLTGIAKYEL